MSTWEYVWEGYNPARQGVRESLCTLGNGYFTTRGAAPEADADGVHYPGTYVAGGYDRATSQVCGREVGNEDLVNFPNWLPLRFRLGDHGWLDGSAEDLLSYSQSLDLQAGILHRELAFRDPAGRITRIRTDCLVSMSDPHVGAIRQTITAENWSGPASIESYIDHGVVNAGVARYQALEQRHLDHVDHGPCEGGGVFAHVRTRQSRLEVAQAAWTRVHHGAPTRVSAREPLMEPGRVGERIGIEMTCGEPVSIEKVMALHTSRDPASAGCVVEACSHPARTASFDDLAAEHCAAWAGLWRHADIALHNESGLSQLALRMHVFHLLQTVSPHSVELDVGVPARGLHGEAYRGHVFWDELFILPFFNYRFPDMSEALLRYRHRRLPQARRAARAAGLNGALFPWQSSSNGREESQRLHLNPRSGRWLPDHSHLQRHVNAAIAFNVWRYFQTTRDLWFLKYAGGELLIEIARLFASLAHHDPGRDRFEIRGVVGPDEYHDRYPGSDSPGVDNNAYTNLMAVWVLRRALQLRGHLPVHARDSLFQRLEVAPWELEAWEAITRRMHVPFLANGLIAQFDGYEALEEFDWAGYREKYGNIKRLDRILESEGDSPNRYKLSKQADVLMLFYLLSADEIATLLRHLGYAFDRERIPETVQYYLERTSHGSTLSAVVHAWVLSRGDPDAGFRYFESALQSDISEVQDGTTAEGIHLGAMAATVDIAQRAYTGCEYQGGHLCFSPRLPGRLSGLAMELRYHSNRISVDVSTDALEVTAGQWSRETLEYYIGGQRFELAPGERRRHMR